MRCRFCLYHIPIATCKHDKWKMELATTQTSSASLNAFPYRSPRGHFHITAQEVATQPFLSLSYLLATCKHDKWKMELATTQT